MRTLTEMTTRIQRYLADTDADHYSEATILQAGYMKDAAAMLWEDILSSPRGRRGLRTYSDYTALTADTELYDLPDDCLLLDGIEVRWRDADDRPLEVPYQQPPQGEFRNGTAALFGASGYAGSGTPGGLRWYDDCEPHQVRVWPCLSSISEQKYRFRYYAEPVFPSNTGGTFNDPTDSGTDTRHLPDEVAGAVEFLTAALASSEEVEHGRPVGAFGNLYRSRVQALTSSRMDRAAPRRKYIRTGRRR